MTRSNYSDACEHLGLYRAAVDRAISGPRGQAFMRELVSALDAMSVKKLAADLFVDGGEVCAMGSVAEARGLDTTNLDEHDPTEVGALLGIPHCLAAEIAFENDEHGPWYGREETNEQRWQRMRNWAAANVQSKRPTPIGACTWCLRRYTLQRGKIHTHKYNGAKCPGAGQSPRDQDKA